MNKKKLLLISLILVILLAPLVVITANKAGVLAPTKNNDIELKIEDAIIPSTNSAAKKLEEEAARSLRSGYADRAKVQYSQAQDEYKKSNDNDKIKEIEIKILDISKSHNSNSSDEEEPIFISTY